jgi:thioredoxin 1
MIREKSMKSILMTLGLTLLLTIGSHAGTKNEENIKQALSSGKPSIVDFGAGKCIPCKKMKPILDSLRKEYEGRANVVFVDVWEDKEIGNGYRVQMIPTQIFYDTNGKEVKRHMGFMDRVAILKELQAAGLK